MEAKAKVILVNRSWDTGSDAIRGIKKDFGVDSQVEWYHCDLGNLKETREVFMGIREREKRLDLVRCLHTYLPCADRISYFLTSISWSCPQESMSTSSPSTPTASTVTLESTG